MGDIEKQVGDATNESKGADESCVCDCTDESCICDCSQTTDEIVEEEEEILPEIIVEPEVRTFEDLSTASDFELKHYPHVSLRYVPEDDRYIVDVHIGEKVAHPQTEEHYIEWIELWADRFLLEHCDRAPGDKLKIRFIKQMNHGDIVRARISCNLHGLWESETEVTGPSTGVTNSNLI